MYSITKHPAPPSTKTQNPYADFSSSGIFSPTRLSGSRT